MADTQAPVDVLPHATGFLRHATKEEKRVPQHEDQQQTAQPNVASGDVISILRCCSLVLPASFIETRNKANFTFSANKSSFFQAWHALNVKYFDHHRWQTKLEVMSEVEFIVTKFVDSGHRLLKKCLQAKTIF